jgi:microsomal dipeptidase-like Zn-dependent dipeptidase
MHLLARDPAVQAHLPDRRNGPSPSALTLEHVVRVRRQPGVLAKARAFLLLVIAKLFNNESFKSGWRVDLPRLAAGGVRIVFSVLYLPWTEIDDPNRDGDYDELLGRLKEVESELCHEPKETRPVVVKREADLDRALAEKRIAIVHSIEGGMHLGRDLRLISDRVAELAHKGVSYITLAHLFYRGVATNAPALPMLSDRAYNAIFCQPKGGGLSPVGEAAVRAMYEHGVLVDVSHMRADALAETFALLRTLDEETGADPADHPVMATHAGYRFGSQAYMLDDETIREIAARDGVVGLIMAEHQLNDNLDVSPLTGEAATFERVRRHVEEIRRVAGSNRHAGIGSDLDGFIKPTVAGITNVDDLAKLRKPLEDAYGADTDAILGGNAERVLRKALRARA